MKKHYKILMISAFVIALITATTLAVINITKSKGDVDSEILVSRNYQQVEPGDEAIEGTDFVTFDAYYLRDLDGDGYAEKIRGSCRQIGKEDTLYIDLNVLTNGTLKNGKITINGKNMYYNTAIVKDSVIAKDCVYYNTETIELNDVSSGTQKLIFGNSRSGNYSYSSEKNSALRNNINNYSVEDNSITLTGTHVADDGTETEISKTVYFTNDWYGETYTYLTSYYKNQKYGIDGIVDDENSTVNMYFKIATYEDKKELLLSKNHVEGIVPTLNGYDPIIVTCLNDEVNFNYSNEERKFIIENVAQTDDNGNITRSVSKDITYELVVTYPKAAYDAAEQDTINIVMPVVSWYEGYNLNDINYSNPYKSNVAQDVISVLYCQPVGENARVDVYVGQKVYDNYIGEYRRIVSKEKPNGIYNHIIDEPVIDSFYVTWHLYTGTQANNVPVVMKETPENYGDRFLDVDATYQDALQYISNYGIYFDYPQSLLGEDGYINVYDDENDELIHTFTKNDWNYYNRNNPYMYTRPIKHIRIETSNVGKSASLYTYHLKYIDDELLTANYTKEEFDKLAKIYSHLIGYSVIDGEREKLDESISCADYEVPSSFASISLDRSYISNQETVKNCKITIETVDEGYNSGDWKNGIYLVKFPEEIVAIDIKSVVVNDAKIVVNGYDCYKSGDNYYLKIYTENEEETKYKINIFADITANPSKATSVRDLELYSINQYVDNYYVNKSSEDIYDLNSNGRTDDYCSYAKYSLDIIAPTNLITTQYLTNYDDNDTVTIAPQIAEINKEDESRTADVNISLKNNYSGTISEISIIAKVPKVNNSYVINGSKIGSQFDSDLVSNSLVIPEEIRDYVTVYYSTNDTVNKDLNDAQNGWTTTPDNFAEVKSIMLSLGDYIMPVGDEKVFKYQINIPTSSAYNTITYSDHAVFYNLDTDQGKLPTQTEPNKIGIKIAEKYDLVVDKIENLLNYHIPNATLSVTDKDTGISTAVVTGQDGKATFKNLYVEKEYTFKELVANSNYTKNTNEVKFIGHIIEGQLIIELLDGEFSDNIVIDNTITNENKKVNVKFENEVKFDVKLQKTDFDTDLPIDKIKFSLIGDNKTINVATNSEGIIRISSLKLNTQYILREIDGKGYYLKEDISFIAEKDENGNVTIRVTSGEFDSEPVIERNNNSDKPLAIFTLKNEIIPKYKLKVVKYEKDNEENKLKGAMFELNGPGFDKKRYTTNEEGVIEIEGLYEYVNDKDLDTEYTLTEILPPVGYAQPGEGIRFYAQRDSSDKLNIYINNSYYCRDYLKEYTVVEENEEEYVQFKIENNPIFTLKKIDSESGEPIEGAYFKITDKSGYTAYDSQGNEIGEDEIFAGSLTFTSPSSQEHPWRKDDNGNWISTNTQNNSEGYIISNKFNIDNEFTYLRLEVAANMVDSYSDMLVVEVLDGNTNEVVDSQKYRYYSLDEGYLQFRIPEGTYKIKISYARNRYEGGGGFEASSITYTNEEIANSVVIGESQFLKLKVLKTDENGEIKLNLGSGMYIATEVEPAEGYELNTESQSFGISQTQAEQYSLNTIWQNKDNNYWSQRDGCAISDTEFATCTENGKVIKYTVTEDNKVVKDWESIGANYKYRKIISNGEYIFVSDDSANITKYDLNGNIIWEKRIAGVSSVQNFILYEDEIYIYDYYNGIMKMDNDGVVSNALCDHGAAYAEILPNGTYLFKESWGGITVYDGDSKLVWEDDSISSAYPHYIDGYIYACSSSYMYKYTIDGELIYKTPWSGNYIQYMVMYNGILIGTNYGRYLYAINPEDGSLYGSTSFWDYHIDNWQKTYSNFYGMANGLISIPNVGVIVVKYKGGTELYYSIEVNENNRIQWNSKNEDDDYHIYRSIAEDQNKNYFIGDDNGKIAKVTNDGTIEWEKKIATNSITKIITMDDGLLAITPSKTIKIDYYGNEIWSSNSGAMEAYLDSTGKLIMTGFSKSPSIYRYEIGETGLTLEKTITTDLNSTNYSKTALKILQDENDNYYVLLRYGHLYKLDSNFNLVWYKNLDDSNVNSMTLKNDSTIATINSNGYLSIIDMETGEIIESNKISSNTYIDINYLPETDSYLASTTSSIIMYNSDLEFQGSGFRGISSSTSIYDSEYPYGWIIDSDGYIIACGADGNIEKIEIKFKEASVAEATNLTFENTKKRYNITTEVKSGEGTISGEGLTPYEVVKHGENSQNEIIAIPGENFNVIKITVNGEEIPFTINEDGSVEIEKFENMTSDKHVVVEFSENVSEVVVHHYIEGTTTKVAEDEFKYGVVGEEYSTSPKTDLEKYELIKDENGYIIPENASGTFTNQVQVVTYYYAPRPLKLIVHHYIVGTSDSIAPDEISYGNEGETYNTAPISNISEKYSLVTSLYPENANGTYQEPETEVIYYYQKNYKNITTEVDGIGGSISGEGEQPYEKVLCTEDSIKDIIAMPNEGYRIEKITVNGEEIDFTTDSTNGSTKLDKFINVIEDKHIVVKFVKNQECKLTINKVDDVTGDRLPNTTIKVSNAWGSNEYTTDENGQIKIDNIYIDIEYTLKETRNVDGYILPEGTDKFRLYYDNEEQLKIEIIGENIKDYYIDQNAVENSITISYKNNPNFVLQKYGPSEDIKLENVKFIIKKINEENGNEENVIDINGNPVGTTETIDEIEYTNVLTTDSTGRISALLTPGTYKITEIKAAQGYKLPEGIEDRTQTFVIENGDSIYVLFDTISHNKISTPLNFQSTAMSKANNGTILVGGQYEEVVIPGENTISGEEIVIENKGYYRGNIIKYDDNNKAEKVLSINSKDGTEEKMSGIFGVSGEIGEKIVAIGIAKGSILIDQTQTKSGEEIVIDNIEDYTYFIIVMDNDLKVERIELLDYVPFNTSVDPAKVNVTLNADATYKVTLPTNGNITIPAEKTVDNESMELNITNNDIEITYTLDGKVLSARIAQRESRSGGEYLASASVSSIENDSEEISSQNMNFMKTINTKDGTKIKIFRGNNVSISGEYTEDGVPIFYSGYTQGIVKYNLDGKIATCRVVMNNDICFVDACETENGVAVLADITGNRITFDAEQTKIGQEISDYNESEASNMGVIVEFDTEGLVLGAKVISDEIMPDELVYEDNYNAKISYSNNNIYVTYKDYDGDYNIIEAPRRVFYGNSKTQTYLTMNNTPDDVKITTEVDGDGGIISGQDENPYETVAYLNNSTKEIKATPDSGYKITSITINGEPIEFTPANDGTYTLPLFENMIEDKHIVVKFERKDTSIIVKHQTEDGTDLVTPETRPGKVGDEYRTDPMDFEEYDLKTTPDNANGNMAEEQIEVIYVYSKVKGTITVNKVDKTDSSIKLEGATFRLEKLDDTNNVDSTFEAIDKDTNEQGQAIFENLDVGKYRLTEVKAPQGYELTNEVVDVEVTKAERDISVTASDRMKIVLPATGKINYSLIISGIGLIAITTAFVLKKKEKKASQE